MKRIFLIFFTVMALIVKIGATSSVIGVDWTETKIGGNHNWNGIAYDSAIGKWCVVAGGNVKPTVNGCATTTDFKTFTFGTTGAMLYPNVVNYGNGILVCAGFDGKISSSTDGLNWTVRYTDPDTAIFYDVIWGDTIFMATACGTHGWDTHGPNWVITSPDGTTWTKRTLPDSIRAEYLTFGHPTPSTGLWIVSTSDSGKIYTSPNSVTWAKIAMPSPTYGVTGLGFGYDNHGRGVFTARNTLGCLYSYTGTSGWTTGNGPALKICIAKTIYANGLFVSINYNDVDNTGINLITSPDGVNWTARSTDTLVSPFYIAYGNGTFASISYATTSSQPIAADTSVFFTSSNVHSANSKAAYEMPITINPAFVDHNDSISFPIRLSKITDNTFWGQISSDTNFIFLDAKGNVLQRYCDSLNIVNKKGIVTVRTTFDTTIPNTVFLEWGKTVGNYNSINAFPSKCTDRFSFDETSGKALNTIRAYHAGSVGAITRISSRLNNGASLTGTQYFTDSSGNILNRDYNQKWSVRMIYKQRLPVGVNTGLFCKAVDYYYHPGINVFFGAGILYFIEVGSNGDYYDVELSNNWPNADTSNYHVLTFNYNGTWGGISLYVDNLLMVPVILHAGVASSILSGAYAKFGTETFQAGELFNNMSLDEMQIYNTDTISANQIKTWSKLVLNDTAIIYGTSTGLNGPTGGNGGLVAVGAILLTGIGIGIGRRKQIRKFFSHF